MVEVGPREEAQRRAAWLPEGVGGDEGPVLALGVRTGPPLSAGQSQERP